MKYMGSKSRIAKDIVPIIQKYIDNNETDNYYEPFVGGCNIIDKINSTHKYASDLNKYLIALLTHVSNGGELYDSVSRELYNEAKVAYKNNDKTKFEDYQIANIGFLASYNGRWFDGGYAKPVYEKTKTGLRYRDYYREAKDNLLKQATDLLKPGGRCAVITFNSLEDRIVKNYFRSLTSEENTSRKLPQIKQNIEFELVNRKVIIATEEEVERNNRAKPAKLRIIERK